VGQSSKSEEEIRGSAQSSPEAIIRDGTIVRSVEIFGTVEVGDDDPEEGGKPAVLCAIVVA
jgi:hypothetical protein